MSSRTQSLAQVVERIERRLATTFLGKYEAVVTDTDDPLEIGRLRARVPAVLGEETETGWALPCAPFGGGPDRGFLALPEPGDTVWIEFVSGDVSRPVWSGAFWGSPESSGQQDDLGGETGSELPEVDGARAGPGRTLLKTTAGHHLLLDDEGELVILGNGNGKTEIRLTRAGEVIVTADKIELGDGATEALVLGNAFQTLFNSHTHPTGVGPSGPPTQPMTPSHLSRKSSTE